jgi:predicted RNase H-like nuclease
VIVVGVDGCRSGWFWVCLMDSGKWEADIEPSFGPIWTRWHEADSLFVDIPIGLRDSGREERLCDREARKALGAPRRSSVFPAPCRSSLCAEGYRDACRINRRCTGRRLSKQSWNIAGKIRDVDSLLQSNSLAKVMVREVHPEVLFWALNRGASMQHNKRTEAGFRDRLRLLERRYPGSQAIVTMALNTHPRKAVGRDDILDALAAAVTGRFGKGSFHAFPDRPERDSTGLPMEIVYHRC